MSTIQRHRVFRGFTLIELLVVMATMGVLVGVISPAAQRLRTAAEETHQLREFKQLSIAIFNYDVESGNLRGVIEDLLADAVARGELDGREIFELRLLWVYNADRFREASCELQRKLLDTHDPAERRAVEDLLGLVEAQVKDMQTVDCLLESLETAANGKLAPEDEAEVTEVVESLMKANAERRE